MLTDMMRRSVAELKLGVRPHAALLSGSEKISVEVFQRDKECCHVCGVRVPGFMEIDHRDGHKKSSAKSLKTICQFCHNLRHPIWAATRKRIIPIFAPDLNQADIHRLAWTLLAWRGVSEGPVDHGSVAGLIDIRRETFLKEFGCESAESLFEAAYAVAGPKMLGGKGCLPVFRKMEQSLRFWPAELLYDYEELDPGSRLSVWDVGGFRCIADEAAEAIRTDQEPDFGKIHELTASIMEEMAGQGE